MNPKICKKLIETLLKIKVEKIEYIESEKSVESPYLNHGVRFDVYVKDSNKIYDIELQTYDDDIPKRMRYYQSMMDMDCLMKGQEYSELKETFIIFICTFDPFGQNQPCYLIQNKYYVEETKTFYDINDGAKKIVFNASAYEKEKDIEIKNFLKYTSSNKATGQFAIEINQIVERMKNSNSLREEVMFISDEIQYYRRKAREEGREEGLLEGREEGREEGRLEVNRENALKMLKDN